MAEKNMEHYEQPSHILMLLVLHKHTHILVMKQIPFCSVLILFSTSEIKIMLVKP